MRIINVVGARPNLMKIAPLMEAYAAAPEIEPLLIHTGQHYDANMSELFFRQLGIPEPELNLGVGSASHAVQTAEIMRAFEPVVQERRPDAVLVVGDVNSTIGSNARMISAVCTACEALPTPRFRSGSGIPSWRKNSSLMLAS